MKTAFLTLAFLCFLTVNLQSQTCNNNFPLTNNVSIKTAFAPKPLTIGGNLNCTDVALQLRYDNELPYYGILALCTPGNFNRYSKISGPSDFVLSALSAEDLILNTQKPSGHIRFATTDILGSENYPEDVERMTIIPDGKIGIGNNTPDNLFSIRTPIGIDFYNNDEGFQDIRFNCYQTVGSAKDVGKVDSIISKDGLKLPLTPGYVNIQSGFSGIIQTRNTLGWGSMLLAVSESNSSEDSEVDFFEWYQHGSAPKGIMIQNFLDPYLSDYSTIGIGAMPTPNSRITIQGRTSDNTMAAISVLNSDNVQIFKVDNDGLISIGEKTFIPATNPDDLDEDLKLSVDGAIAAKEILIESSTLKWADFVFDENYRLMPLTELEHSIEREGKLPDIPSAKEIQENGLNLAEMDSKLLQKIEELTLYVIQLNKDNEELRREIEILKSKGE